MSRKMCRVYCENCKKEFEKQERYVKITERKGRKHFCTLSCSAKFQLLDDTSNFKPHPEYLIPGNAINRKDENSEFRYYIRKAIYRQKLGDLTIEDISDCWYRQAGKCALSGLPMKLRGQHTSEFEMASLDRIDSRKPYEKNNIQFVVLPLNRAKHSSSNENFKYFLKKLKESIDA